jgi:hypothetical protein
LKKPVQYFTLLILISIALIIGAIFLFNHLNDDLKIPEIILITLSFSAVSLTSILIFLKGQKKEIKIQPLFTLVAVSLKFLLELVVALIWFIVAKKTAVQCILLFFVLYLTFTMFSIWVILNTLKNKSL